MKTLLVVPINVDSPLKEFTECIFTNTICILTCDASYTVLQKFHFSSGVHILSPPNHQGQGPSYINFYSVGHTCSKVPINHGNPDGIPLNTGIFNSMIGTNNKFKKNAITEKSKKL